MGIFDIFSDKPAQQAAQAQRAGIDSGLSLASGLYGQGRQDVTSNFGDARDYFTKLLGASGAGAGAYADATGVGGPEGLARARTAFTSTPGYTEGLNLALDQNDRRAASRGMLASGNTVADTTRLSNDYASQRYQDYVSRLLPFLGQQSGATAGAAGVSTGQGSTLNANDVGQANLGFGAEAAKGNVTANAELAKYSTSANLFNALLKVAGLGSNTIGGSSIGSAAGGANSWLQGLLGAGGGSSVAALGV